MKKWIALALVLVLCLPCMALGEAAPGDAAMNFLLCLKDGDLSSASRQCTDDTLSSWAPPAVTRLIVYPSIADIAVKQTQVNGGEAVVTLAFTAVDLSDPALLSDAAEALGIDDVYQADIPERALINLIYGQADVKQALAFSRASYEMPVALRLKSEDYGAYWTVDMPKTLALWPRSPAPAVRVSSYDLMDMDAAQLSYYIDDAYALDALRAPEGMSSDAYRASLTPETVFSALGLPVWNAWLRLSADTACEQLSDFTMEGGQCSAELERYYDYSEDLSWYNVGTKRWIAKDAGYEAYLTARLPAAQGEPLTGEIACTQRMNALTPLYSEREVRISLQGAPRSALVPREGVTATAQYFTRLTATQYTDWQDNPVTVNTLGELMRDEYDNGMYISIWPDAPKDALVLPVVNDQYALYRVQGRLNKLPGGFGAYDLVFSCDAPGVWAEAYEQCDSCWAKNGFDLCGADSTLSDCVQNDFDMQLLVAVNGRTEAELDAFVRNLTLNVTFSAEKIDFCYEQHGTTTRIGPRQTIKIDTSGMERWTGSVRAMPEAAYLCVPD